VLGEDLKGVDGAAAGAWIEPRLRSEVGSVGSLVPTGFEAYARIFHPASDAGGRSARWSEVAEAMGTTAHRKMQWYALVRSPDPCTYDESRWRGSGPMTGQLETPDLGSLCEILAIHTSESDSCFFGLCTIIAWTEQIVPPEEQKQPLLKLPLGREHVVLQGPIAGEGTEGRWGQISPNLIWPPDRSWLVASEVDFDSTLVGGSAELIEAIVDSPALEAWHVEPDDSLTCDADEINVIESV
jgi:hypothetical protein